MVTLLTDYLKQRRTLNSMDDVNDIEWHNGDEVLLMDMDAVLIFSEEDNNWYPVPTGGGGGGGGMNSDKGSFTLASSTQDVTINHSLNTEKLFGLVWLEPDSDNQVITVTGYQLIVGPFTTRNYSNDLYTGTTLVSNYTSNATKTAAYTSRDNKVKIMKSAWSNAAAAFSNLNLDIRVDNVTNNSFTLHVIGTNGPYLNAGTYRWKIWTFEEGFD